MGLTRWTIDVLIQMDTHNVTSQLLHSVHSLFLSHYERKRESHDSSGNALKMLQLMQSFGDDNPRAAQLNALLDRFMTLMEDRDVVNMMMNFYVFCSDKIVERQVCSMQTKYAEAGIGTNASNRIMEEEIPSMEQKMSLLKVVGIKAFWWFLVDDPRKNVTGTSDLVKQIEAVERSWSVLKAATDIQYTLHRWTLEQDFRAPDIHIMISGMIRESDWLLFEELMNTDWRIQKYGVEVWKKGVGKGKSRRKKIPNQRVLFNKYVLM